jgi:hypothetical protein
MQRVGTFPCVGASMQEFSEKGFSNPHDISLHKQIKDVADLLRPELLRLYKSPSEVGGNMDLYKAFTEEIFAIKREVANSDALFSLRNIISHMQKVAELSNSRAQNQEILTHLQEVMSLLFKVQSLPS